MMRQITDRTRMTNQRLGLAALLALFGSTGAALAEAPASTLKKIAETGVVRIGYSREDFPFSFVQQDGTVGGYSTELCLDVVDIIKRKLGLATVRVDYVQRTPRNRVALLRNGTLDIECVASTNNAERRKSASFSYPHFVTGTQFVSLKKSNLKTIADLTGHTVAATSATTNIGQLNTVNRERGLNIAVMAVETIKDGFQLVTEGRASAFVSDGILLAALVAQSARPEDYLLSTDALGWPEPYGLMVRLGDVEFKDAVNAALVEIYGSGRINALYDKWFTQPVAPVGINMRLPMSDEVRKAFAKPADPVD